MPSTKNSIIESLERAEDNFHGFTVFILGIGIVFLFLTLTRFLLGIMTCLDLIFDRASKKATKKVESAKKRAGGASSKSSKKKKRSTSSKSSKASKTLKTSKTSKRSSQSVPSTRKEKNDLKKRGASTNASSKTSTLKAVPTGAIKKDNLSKSDSSKKDGSSNSSSGKKFKRWIVEKRKSFDTNKSSDSSAIKATSVDLLATPKTAHKLTTATNPSGKSVTFNNVQEPAANTTHKYASVATPWPGSERQEAKLYKSDDCPTPNPFRDPSLNTSPYVLGAPPKTSKIGDDSNKKVDTSAAPKRVSPENIVNPQNEAPKRASEYNVYAPHEVPSQFATDNVKTALEGSNPTKKKCSQKTSTKKSAHQIVIPMPSSSDVSIQATQPATSDTQNSLTLQSPIIQPTPQVTSDTQNSSSLQSPVRSTEKKKL